MTCGEKILSDDFVDFIKDNTWRSAGVTEGEDFCNVELDQQFTLSYVSTQGRSPLEISFADYHDVPGVYGLMQMEGDGIEGQGNGTAVEGNGIAAQREIMPEPFDTNALGVSGILQVQRYPLNLTGRGVVICMIGTGIDYTSEIFRNEQGGSRITAIWDQTIQGGEPPEGFMFGTEYTREDIDRALQAEDPYTVVPSRDENGHCSAMASVAAGSRIDTGNRFLGAAPDAEIVIVKLKECKAYLRDYYLLPTQVPAYAENDIMLAVKYADSFGDLYARPVVICLGLGSNLGSHSSSTPLSIYLDTIAAKLNRTVIVAGGNEGDTFHHFRGELRNAESGGDSYEDVLVRVSENIRGFVMEFWGSIPDVFDVTIRSPGGETIPAGQLGSQQPMEYRFIYESTVITMGISLVEPGPGAELFVIRLENPTPGIWYFRVKPVGEVYNGIFHVWLPLRQFLDAPVLFLEPDVSTTLTTPSLANDVLSVSTYDSQTSSFYTASGRGFAKDGYIRPDIAAPGVNISTMYGKRTGSSLAAAMTAGGVAQFLEWAVVNGNVTEESRFVNNFFIRGATREANLEYPSIEWGYGRLNVLGIFEAMTLV